MAETIAEALRDLEAAKARVERDAGLAAGAMKKSLLEQLLPVLDNLDRTLASASPAESPALVEGVAMVRAQLEGVLRGYGVERIDAANAPFDPAIHEAISVAPVATPAADNTVVEQLAAGYRYQGALMRPARVVVGKLAAAPVPLEDPPPANHIKPIAPPSRAAAAWTDPYRAPHAPHAESLRSRVAPQPIAAPREPEAYETRPIRRAIPRPQPQRMPLLWDPWGRSGRGRY